MCPSFKDHYLSRRAKPSIAIRNFFIAVWGSGRAFVVRGPCRGLRGRRGECVGGVPRSTAGFGRAVPNPDRSIRPIRSWRGIWGRRGRGSVTIAEEAQLAKLRQVATLMARGAHP
jgi:hypothetical protein